MLEESANHGVTGEISPKIPNRRQVIKAGVWAAPVVAVALATPAASASGTLTLALASGPFFYVWGADRPNAVRGALTVSNTTTSKTGSPVRDVAVKVSVSSAAVTTAAPTAVTGGWASPTAGVVVGANTEFTFTYAGPLSQSSAQPLAFTLTPTATPVAGAGWTASATGTPTRTDGTIVTGGSTSGAIAIAEAGVAAAVVAPQATLTRTGNPAKEVTASIAINATGPFTARLTVTSVHKDDSFVGPWAGGTITESAVAGGLDIATTTVLPAGSTTVTFPKYVKQGASSTLGYKIEVFFGGALFSAGSRSGSNL